MQQELDTMHNRKVWDLVEKPESAKILGSRWVYSLKRDENGGIKRFKARLVAQGFRQQKGETYDEVFSPVVNFGIIRFFFAILVNFYRWYHLQCDVKCAYLYAPLEETIYMRQPPGFVNSNFVCKLKRAIYGLKQSGREWFFEIHKTLNELGFKKFSWCNCTYRFGKNVILLLYVDDIVIFGRKPEHAHKALKLLQDKFDLKLLGKTKKLLGVEFVESQNQIAIHQRDYINELCEQYDKFNFPISSLPIAKGVVYSKTQCPVEEKDKKEMERIPYRNLIGSLAFLANRTRPDISYALNIFSQFQSNPGISHWMGLLKLLGYVKYTKDLQLNLSKITDLNLITYTDADFANNKDDRTSMGGMIVLIDKVPITWRSSKQKLVCLSSMESEFVALTEASKELIWYQRILKEGEECEIFKLGKNAPTLFADNQACMDFTKSPIENHRSKHIDVKLFFVRDLIYQKTFDLKYISSKLNMADIFTKPQTKIRLKWFLEQVFK